MRSWCDVFLLLYYSPCQCVLARAYVKWPGVSAYSCSVCVCSSSVCSCVVHVWVCGDDDRHGPLLTSVLCYIIFVVAALLCSFLFHTHHHIMNCNIINRWHWHRDRKVIPCLVLSSFWQRVSIWVIAYVYVVAKYATTHMGEWECVVCMYVADVLI